MSDLIERLRAVAEHPEDFALAAPRELCGAAADRIEYLESVAGPVAKATDMVNEVKGRRAKPEDEK